MLSIPHAIFGSGGFYDLRHVKWCKHVQTNGEFFIFQAALLHTSHPADDAAIAIVGTPKNCNTSDNTNPPTQ